MCLRRSRLNPPIFEQLFRAVVPNSFAKGGRSCPKPRAHNVSRPRNLKGWLKLRMSFEKEHPHGEAGKTRKSLQGDEKNVIALLLPDDALESRGFRRGERVVVEIGEVCENDLAAVRSNDGHWYIGCVSIAAGGMTLTGADDGLPPPFFRTETIIACGRVTRSRTRSTACTATHVWAAPLEAVTGGGGLPVMTWQMDAHGVVTHADHACREFLGLSESELRAGVWKSRIHPDDREPYLCSRERAIAEGAIYRNSVRILDASKEYRLLSIIVAPFFNDSGFITAWHAVAELAEGLIKLSA